MLENTITDLGRTSFEMFTPLDNGTFEVELSGLQMEYLATKAMRSALWAAKK